MARFDVHRLNDGDLLVVDVQGDQLGELQSRFVVPLLPTQKSPHSRGVPHPIVTLSGTRYFFASHLLGAVPLVGLGAPIASLADQQEAMLGALKGLLGALWS